MTDTGDGSELTIGWADAMTLHIDADFAEGKDKTIEITLPIGMTFSVNADGNQRYVTSDLTFSEKKSFQQTKLMKLRRVRLFSVSNNTTGQ